MDQYQNVLKHSLMKISTAKCLSHTINDYTYFIYIYIYIYMYTYMYVTLSHLRSKAQAVVHNLCTTLVVDHNIHTIPTAIHHHQQQE